MFNARKKVTALLSMLAIALFLFDGAVAYAEITEFLPSDFSGINEPIPMFRLESAATKVAVRSVSLVNKKTVSLNGTVSLKASIKPSNATNKGVTWSSSNKKVAAVNSKGVVTGKKTGTATITATTRDGKKTATCKVTVKRIAVKTVSLKKKATVSLNKTIQLSPIISPTNASNKGVTWKSSNPKVAKVNKNGVVTGKKAGTATITVTTKDKKKTAKCKITVKAVAVKKVTLKKSGTVDVGKTLKLTPTVSPTDASDPSLRWSSGNTKIATVNQKGVVTGKKAGNVTVTAISKNGKAAKCVVTVKKNVAVSGVSIQENAEIDVGETLKLTPVISPADATDQSMSWASSDVDVAAVDKNGVVSGKKAGKAVVTVTTGNGKTARCEVTVFNIAVEVVALQKSVSVKVGSAVTLSPIISPANAFDQSVSWNSSDTGVAIVDANGVVTGKKAGMATITVTTTSMGRTAQCEVTVENIPVTQVQVSSNAVVKVGETIRLSATVSPDDATNKDVAWKSENSAVATVNDTGVVTGVRDGTATIVVRSVDGNKTAKCVVTVDKTVVHVESVTMENALALDLYKTKSHRFTAKVNPANATDPTLKWSSTDQSVATVDANGLMTAKKVGTTKIEATANDGGKYAQCTVTIVDSTPPADTDTPEDKKPYQFAESYVKLNLALNPYYSVSYTAETSLQGFTWTSSEPSVATVDQTGQVTTKKAGRTQITLKSSEGVSGDALTIEVVVPTQRAFLIGQKNYIGASSLRGSHNNVSMMESMLLAGGYDQVTKHYDLNAAELRNALNAIRTKGMTEDDVTLIYYSGHGIEGSSSSSSTNGALTGVDVGYLKVDEVQSILDQIPGTVVVVLDNCLSGQYIETTKGVSLERAVSSKQSNNFNNAWINAFSKSQSRQKALTDSPNAGKYKIITACQPLENSYQMVYGGDNSSAYDSLHRGVFTYRLTYGGGYDFASNATMTRMPADTDGDGIASLQEMYLAVKNNLVNYGAGANQNVMVWPSNDDFAMLRR